MSITRQQAAAELVRRDRALESLAGFSLAIDVPGKPSAVLPDQEDTKTGRLLNRFDDGTISFAPIETQIASLHILMMTAVEEAIRAENGRLMLFFPPGSAKSTYTSVVAPSWAMGRQPGFRTILGSYASTIAAKQSRKARSICSSPRYSSIWPDTVRLADDQRAIDEWALTNGSEFMAAGLLAGITGNRADLLIIDDPVANREQADSATIRAKIYDEYIDTALSRLLPGGTCILIMTRWHEEDLAGSILPLDYNGESGSIDCRDGQTWNVLCVPAEAEREDDPLGRKPGEFLWNEWFGGEKHWSPWRNNPRAARTWAALYQQRPAPDAGIHFNREMFKYYSLDLPRGYVRGDV